MRQKTRLFFSFCISFVFFFTSAVYVWLLSINIIHLSSIRRPPSLPYFSELVNFTSAGKYFVEFKRKKNCYAPAKVGRYWEKTVHSVFITGTEDLRHTYFEVLCLKEHVFIHWRQWTHLITCGKGKFRWLDYLNLNALDKSCGMYNLDRCFFSYRRCKKHNSRVIFHFFNICPACFHGHYFQTLIHA